MPLKVHPAAPGQTRQSTAASINRFRRIFTRIIIDGVSCHKISLQQNHVRSSPFTAIVNFIGDFFLKLCPISTRHAVCLDTARTKSPFKTLPVEIGDYSINSRIKLTFLPSFCHYNATQFSTSCTAMQTV
jgi:hypothetical protein